MITSYSEYLEKPSVLTFEDMTRIHEAIIAGIGEDEEAEAVYDKLVRAGTNYIDTRAGWKLMPKPVRKERNDERTARHNAVIIALDELADCLEAKGKDTAWRKEIGFEAEDKVNRMISDAISPLSTASTPAEQRGRTARQPAGIGV